jgi:hypothetical protein
MVAFGQTLRGRKNGTFHFFLEKKVERQLQGSRKIAKNDGFYRK